jgi:membrane fusion protein (multidrug efflux system)
MFMHWQKWFLFFSSVLILIACGNKTPEQIQSKLPEVVVAESKKLPYNGSLRFVGRLEATASVDLAAKVTGFITERLFKEGEWVSKGDALFLIDKKPFQAEMDKAKAQLQSADAKYRTTQRDFKRSQSLVKSGTISRSDFDRSEGNYLDAKANVSLAKAQVSVAQLNLDYSVVKAPIDGQIGSKNVDVGDLVSPTTGTLTTIKSLDPIQANFAVDEKTYLNANRQRIEEEAKGNQAGKVEVFIELSDGTQYPKAGEISFIDNHIDLQTASIAVRADVPNPDSFLVPGQYVKVIVRLPISRDMITVPQSSLMTDQQGDYLYTVSKTNTVERKNVVLGDRQGTDIFIISGLEAGQKVIVKGLQKVRPKSQVDVLMAKVDVTKESGREANTSEVKNTETQLGETNADDKQ